MDDDLRNWWVSWYARGAWTLYWPWWVTGSDADDNVIICAAVRAATAGEVWDIIQGAHDDPAMFIEERFLEERPDDWSPYRDRFPREDWMRWPRAATPEEAPISKESSDSASRAVAEFNKREAEKLADARADALVRLVAALDARDCEDGVCWRDFLTVPVYEGEPDELAAAWASALALCPPESEVER